MRTLLVIFVLILSPVDLRPQSTAGPGNWLPVGHYSLQLSWQGGKVLQVNPFLRGINAAGVPIDNYQVLSVRLARQTTGTKTWEQLYRFPRCGLGMFMADFGSWELGRPLSVFGFLNGPISRSPHFSLTYELAMGISFNWNYYDPVTNPYNISTSTPVNSMVEAGIGAEIRLLSKLNAGIEAGFNHFSNGAIALPNRGLNGAFIKPSLRYDLYSGDPARIRKTVEKFKRVNEWILACYTGINKSAIPLKVQPVQKHPTEPVFAMGIFGIYHRHLDYKSKIGGGIEFGYIGLINPQYRNYINGLHVNRKPDIRRLDLSIFPSYELVFDRFSLFAQAGFYLYRNELISKSPFFYQRLGFRYYFTDHWFGAIQVRAHHFMVAEMTEWTMGYRF